MSRRVAIVPISVELLASLLKSHERDRVVTDFPDDGKIVSIRQGNPAWTGQIELLVESERFSDVPFAEYPETFTPVYRVAPDDVDGKGFDCNVCGNPIKVREVTCSSCVSDKR